jgi:uncharacterized repeat protein (TIGR01451 family)
MKRLLAALAATLTLAACVAAVAVADPGQSADLRVGAASDAASHMVGDLVTYTITVMNEGEATSDGSTLNVLLPSSLQLVSVDAAATDASVESTDYDLEAIDGGTLAVSDIAPDSVDSAAARIVTASTIDLGYTASTTGADLVRVDIGSLPSTTYSSEQEATRTVTLVARATASGSATAVAEIESSLNPDPAATNNYALSTVTVTS